MGCWYRWEHSSFASFNPRFDPGTVHQKCIASSIGRALVSKTRGWEFEALAVRQNFISKGPRFLGHTRKGDTEGRKPEVSVVLNC